MKHYIIREYKANKNEVLMYKLLRNISIYAETEVKIMTNHSLYKFQGSILVQK